MIVLGAAASAGQAGVRSFFSPKIFGDSLAFCTTTSGLCGKPIADAWCRHKGFDEALLYQRARPQGTSPIRYGDTGDICTDKQCLSFRQIKCYSQN